MKNKKTWTAIISVIALVLIIIGVTYAYWLVTETQTNSNVISTGCLDITLNGEANDINLPNQFPMSDEDGMELTPYEFTITNNCTTSVDYHVNLESIGTESTAINASAIKAVLNENTPKILYDYVGTEPTINGAYESYTLLYGTLAGSSPTTTEDTATYNLRLWIDANAPISEMNKTYEGKISVSVGQNISSQGNTLASLILADAEGNDYLYNTTPDFSEPTVEGEYGLYQAADDYGTSYYFRGDVENNRVAFGPKTYQGAFVPSNISGELLATAEGQLYASFVFNNKEFCELIGVESSAWITCEENKNIETVYNSGTGAEETMNVWGFTTEQNCIGAMQAMEIPVTSCSTKEVERGYLDLYWRIIRINGDGTIRMIYDGISPVENGVAHTATIADTAYNTDYNDAKYVGYTYDDNGTETDSTIKGVLESWYETNLEENYGKYIADTIFCNDREIANTSGSYIYYGAYNRLDTNKNPKLSCTQDSDKYTVSKTKGNGLLTNPVGLITADEVAMAGGLAYNGNATYYLYNGGYYWAMTPLSFSGSGAGVWRVTGGGSLGYDFVYIGIGGRPVINLKSDSLFEGSGTITDPYKLAIEN